MNKNFRYLGEGSRTNNGLGRSTSITHIPDKNGDIVVLIDDNNVIVSRGIFHPWDPGDFDAALMKFEDWVMAKAEKVGRDITYTVHSWTKVPVTMPLKERLERFDEWISSGDG